MPHAWQHCGVKKAVFEALKKERSEEQREERMITELATSRTI